MGKISINSYGDLFNDCATACEAYTACGGFRNTAPCGCAWPVGSKLRKKCDECYLLCRERPDFVARLSEGKLIEQVSIKHEKLVQLPLFIPINTHDYQGSNSVLPLRWVAADLRIIFNLRKKLPATLKPHFKTSATAREYLHVNSKCQLITILNGKDKFLESFWGMDRGQAFKHLKEIGFTIGTGPTYSVSEFTPKNTPTPYAHHTAMLMRHHKVISELQYNDICPIPNLYWVDNDQQEINKWGEWLLANPFLRYVSRDFTMTGNKNTIEKKVDELLQILKIAGRSFHIVIVGTGATNAPIVLQKLYNAGHSASIVTSAPIFHALNNRKYEVTSDNKIIREEPLKAIGFHELILHNLYAFEKVLSQVVSISKNVSPTSYNLSMS
ncbi:hypothetical protein GC194_10110 [bacterium]|nr:hypothetical protein [bacterium]